MEERDQEVLSVRSRALVFVFAISDEFFLKYPQLDLDYS